jgi:hypothetical protein
MTQGIDMENILKANKNSYCEYGGTAFLDLASVQDNHGSTIGVSGDAKIAA